MAVKETPDANSGGSGPDVYLEWNAENELQLFQVLCGNKPIGIARLLYSLVCIKCGLNFLCMFVGISRYFQMACVVEKLASNLNKEITSKVVWDHLSSMYDLKKLVRCVHGH